MASVSAPSSVAQPQQLGFRDRVKELSLIVVQMAIRIFFILASLLGTAALFPASLHSFAIPVAALSATALSGFFFPEVEPPSSFPRMPPLLQIPPVQVPIAAGGPIISPPPAPHVAPVQGAAVPDAPRGLIRDTNNCWINADIHLLWSDPHLRNWLRNLMNPNMDMAAFKQFLAEYKTPASIVAEFETYAGTQNPPCLPTVAFGRFLASLTPQKKQETVYIADIFNKLSALHEPFRAFFAAYNATASGQIVQANSQALRAALSQLRPVSQHGQEDAIEPITPLLDLLPDHLKIKMEVVHRLNTQGLPPLADANIRRESFEPIIHLVFKEKEQGPITLQGMLNYYCDRSQKDDTGVEREVSGTKYRYFMEHESWHFLEFPPALRFQIKRHETIYPTPSWLDRLWRTKPKPVSVKKGTPVTIDDELEVTLPDGRKQKYQFVSFIEQYGDMDSGHYRAGLRNNGQRHFMDDGIVTQPDQQSWNTLSSNAYAVFYLPAPQQQAPQPAPQAGH